MSTSIENISSIPELRFKNFDKKWEEVTLGSGINLISGLHLSPGEYNNEGKGIPYFTGPSDFTTESSEVSKWSMNSTNFGERGDVLITVKGSGVGTMTLLQLDKVAMGRQLMAIKSGAFNSEFIYHFLLKKTKYFFALASGNMIPGLSRQDILSLRFYIPTLPEQQKIASFLSAVDEKIQQLTRKKELLEQYKKGVMQQLFSSSELGLDRLKDDRINPSIQESYKSKFRQFRFKDENGKDYPKWEEKRLDEVCEINPSNDDLPESFIYIDLESVVKGQLIQEKTIEKIEAPSRAQRKLQAKDILYQTVRPYQMNNYLFDKEGDYVASTGYAQIRTIEDTRYIYQFLHSEYFVTEVLERCTGTSFPAISSKDLGKIKVLIPIREEQQKIASFLTALDAKIESVAKQITQTQTFKKGLLQ